MFCLEKRAFTVQLVIKTSDGKEFYSKPVENVDRSNIDIVFDDIFYIEDQPPDFELELTICCRRTDENANNLVNTLSRSVGRNVANSLVNLNFKNCYYLRINFFK